MPPQPDQCDGMPDEPSRSSGRFLGAVTRACVIGPILLAVGTTRADLPKPGTASIDDFENKVRPVLVEHCYKCHSAGSESLKGGLRLDSLDSMRKGGDMGAAVVPG
ncbi:c-type cytochrome domain-containing protein, partial [Singulisphaera rosea]